MKSKMNGKSEVILTPENDLEKHILNLSDMIQKENKQVMKNIADMDLSEKLLCKNVLAYLVKIFNDKILEMPVIELDAE